MVTCLIKEVQQLPIRQQTRYSQYSLMSSNNSVACGLWTWPREVLWLDAVCNDLCDFAHHANPHGSYKQCHKLAEFLSGSLHLNALTFWLSFVLHLLLFDRNLS